MERLTLPVEIQAKTNLDRNGFMADTEVPTRIKNPELVIERRCQIIDSTMSFAGNIYNENNTKNARKTCPNAL